MVEPVVLIASGDLRPSANMKCWPAQQKMEAEVMAAVRAEGADIHRGHADGFIASQKQGMEVFRSIHPEAPLIVAEAVWQYSHHVLHGLYTHRGPILTVANWSGEWPGLVGMLNLNGSLTKAGVKYSTLWSVDFTDEFFRCGLRKWLGGEPLVHDTSHARPLSQYKLQANVGRDVARELKSKKAIMGIFDEGCMGMYNAIIPDELLHPTGVFKERLSQSALYAAMHEVSEIEAGAVYDWLLNKGMKFKFGPNAETDLTEAQIIEQCKMYIAVLTIADEFGCDTIGIQYQQGLKDLAPASDLAEGLLNNVDRPPVMRDGRELYAGEALPHFNEVDECAGLDGLVTNRVWKKMGYAPENTLHDLRYGEDYGGQFVWVFEISGAVPPAHLIDGYAGTVSERQPPMYFRLGGGTVKGISKPGVVVWSRIYVEGAGGQGPGASQRLKADLGIADCVELPLEETERRWQITTPQWPIMHAVTRGVSRDQMMARHKANHIQVAYAPDEASAKKALAAKAAAFDELGIEVAICGVTEEELCA
jgi:hypothetical protein